MRKINWVMNAKIVTSIIIGKRAMPNYVQQAIFSITGKKAMPNYVQQAIFSITGKKAQEIPGWAYIVGMIVGLIGLVVLIWISVKSGKIGVQQLAGLK